MAAGWLTHPQGLRFEPSRDLGVAVRRLETGMPEPPANDVDLDPRGQALVPGMDAVVPSAKNTCDDRASRDVGRAPLKPTETLPGTS